MAGRNACNGTGLRNRHLPTLLFHAHETSAARPWIEDPLGGLAVDLSRKWRDAGPNFADRSRRCKGEAPIAMPIATRLRTVSPSPSRTRFGVAKAVAEVEH